MLLGELDLQGDVALVQGSGLRRTMMVIRPRRGVTTDEVSETQPVQVREVPVLGSELE